MKMEADMALIDEILEGDMTEEEFDQVFNEIIEYLCEISENIPWMSWFLDDHDFNVIVIPEIKKNLLIVDMDKWMELEEKIIGKKQY